ncbi:MAG: hypothetical protein ACYSUC_05745 [Planctomycetota bacterium]|jgi:hypothetical protein
MAKNKAGLHKEITAIFGGVPVPKNNRSKPPQRKPVPGRVGYVPMQPEHPEAEIPGEAEPHQPVERLPKPAPLEMRKSDAPPRKKEKVVARKPRIRTTPRLSASGVSPARRKITALIVPVLFVILVLVLMRTFRVTSPIADTPFVAKPPTAAATAASNIEIGWQVPPLYSATPRDPMKLGLLTAGRTESGELVVRGIAHDQDRPYALIGIEIVEEGQKVLGATVVKINRGSVEFEKDGKRWTQQVQSENNSE